MTETLNKSTRIKQTLLQQIREGYFSRGAVLPSERVLAEHFGVSHMTARKAVSALVSEKYLERRAGQGTFVRNDLPGSKVSRQLGVIRPGWEAPEMNDFMMYTSETAEKSGWLAKFFYAKSWRDKAIDAALETCDALIVFSPELLDRVPDKLLDIFKNGDIPVVIVGVPGNVFGIDSVLGLETKPVDMAIDKLMGFGHRDIAFAVQRRQGDRKYIPDEQYLDVWSSRMELDQYPERRAKLEIDLNVQPYALPHRALYERIIEFYKEYDGKLPFTGIIVSVSYVWGAISAFNELKLNIPDDISIVAIGDRQEAEFYCPKLTMIKVPMRKHVEAAWDLINNRLKDKDIKRPQCRYINPEFIGGETMKVIV